MSSVAGILVGLVLLGYGRRLYWAFVAGVGFLTGLALGPRLLPGQPEWMILTAALVLALAGAVLAVVVKKLVIAVIGFFAGGGIGLLLLRQQGQGRAAREPREQRVSVLGAGSFVSSLVNYPG